MGPPRATEDQPPILGRRQRSSGLHFGNGRHSVEWPAVVVRVRLAGLTGALGLEGTGNCRSSSRAELHADTLGHSWAVAGLAGRPVTHAVPSLVWPVRQAVRLAGRACRQTVEWPVQQGPASMTAGSTSMHGTLSSSLGGAVAQRVAQAGRD